MGSGEALKLAEKDNVATSLAELLDPAPTMEEVKGVVAQALGDVFGFNMEWRKDADI